MPDILPEVFTFPLDLFRVVAPRLTEWNVTQPSLPCWRLWWNSEPGAAVRWRGRRVALERDRFVLVAPETHFGVELRRPIERHLFIHFGLNAHRWRVTDRVIVVPADRLTGALVESLIGRLSLDPRVAVAEPLPAIALLSAVLAGVDADQWNSGPTDARIQRVVAALDQSPGLPWANADMARLAALSEGGFVRRFRREMRASPQDYLVRLRLGSARALLLETTLTIEAIAERCGFCDRSYFTTVFRREVGVPPATFRARAQSPAG